MEGGLVGSGWDPPQDVRDGVEFHWWHVPVGGSLLLCVLSQCPVWYVGHYHLGRMRPCAGRGCDLCALGVGRQLRFVVCAAECSTRRVGVLELGSGPGYQLRDRSASNGGLRGTVLEVARSGRSKHCRLELRFVDEHAGPGLLSLEPLELEEVLRTTWKKEERDREVRSSLTRTGN
jgi:hypothetical protein